MNDNVRKNSPRRAGEAPWVSEKDLLRLDEHPWVDEARPKGIEQQIAELPRQKRLSVFSEEELEAMPLKEQQERRAEIQLAVREGRVRRTGHSKTIAEERPAPDSSPLFTEEQIEAMSFEERKRRMPEIQAAAVAGRITPRAS